MFTYSQAHSHASTNATRRHEYFRGLSRLLHSARSFGVISWASFSWENVLFGFSRAPSASLKEPSQSQKGHLSEKSKLNKWHLNSCHWQKSAQSSEIFVISRGICRSVGMSLRKREHLPFWTKMVRTKIRPDDVMVQPYQLSLPALPHQSNSTVA